jgi:hypothetical protein
MQLLKSCSLLLIINLYSLIVFADEPMYCPGRSKYINVGMTVAQLKDACGEPTAVQELDHPATKKVQVKQLMFNAIGSKTAFYGVWAVRSGVDTGAQLEIDVIDTQIVAIKINDENVNATTLCQNQTITVKDPVFKAVNLCGNPSTSNMTYVNMPIPGSSKPQVWTYQSTPYQPTMTFTIVDGKVVSMEKQ